MLLVRVGLRVVQVAVLATGGLAVATGDLVLAVNAFAGFGATLVPPVLDRTRRIRTSVFVELWLAIAVLFHTVGMAGWYETVWWWDHLTHTLSAALLATLADAGIRLFAGATDRIVLPRLFRLVLVLVVTLAAGVLWEVGEFLGRVVARELGHQPLLIQYGLVDTVLDLAFDGLGGLLGLLVLHRVDSEALLLTQDGDRSAASNRKTP